MIKSLVNMARKLGKTTIDLSDVESIKSESYRDTRGISVEQFKLMLDAIASGRSSPEGEAMQMTNDPSTSIGVRDCAIMLLFWGNALRRGEIASANIEDFLLQQQKLTILGKEKRAKMAIDLTDSVSYALEEWLNFHPCNEPEQPLSCLDAHNLERRTVARCILRHTSSTAMRCGRVSRRASASRQDRKPKSRCAADYCFESQLLWGEDCWE